MGRLSSSNNLHVQTDSDPFWSIKEMPQQKTKLPSPGKTTKRPRSLTGPKIKSRAKLWAHCLWFGNQLWREFGRLKKTPFALVATYMLYKCFFPNSEQYKLWNRLSLFQRLFITTLRVHILSVKYLGFCSGILSRLWDQIWPGLKGDEDFVSLPGKWVCAMNPSPLTKHRKHT